MRNDGNGVDVGAFESQAAAPQVESVLINGGDTSRSKITSVSVTFDTEVDHPAALQSAFSITNITTSTSVGTVNVAATNNAGKTTAVLTFAGASTLAPLDGTLGLGTTLVDGNYRLDIVADQSRLRPTTPRRWRPITYSAIRSKPMPTTTTSSAGHGDDNGDGFTDFTDFASGFLPAFGNASNYNEGLDANSDGFVDFTDFATGFLPKFGTERP